jgi:hypothetical protein
MLSVALADLEEQWDILPESGAIYARGLPGSSMKRRVRALVRRDHSISQRLAILYDERIYCVQNK